MAQRGFTILELMIVVAIAAILLSVAVPSMRSLVLSSRRGDASTSLYGAVVMARSEAIARNGWVILCQRSPVSSRQCQTGGSWTNGWIAFRDNDGLLGANEPAAADIIAVGEASDPAFSINTLPASTNYLSFGPAGTAGAATTLTLCKTGDPSFQCSSIRIAANGRASLLAVAYPGP